MSDIDTPEVFHKGGKDPSDPRKVLPDRPGQRHGKAATHSLKQMITTGQRVRAECYEMDQYSRSVCHVFAGSLNLNLEQLRRGWAMTPDRAEWIRDPLSEPAQKAAKAQRIGVWQDASPKSPADWRKECWGKGLCDGAEN
ncbi:thermonuclease family protein [Achromobacter seleniivolatilans]|uniref:thermonuclease family protein n=1 Tax=Achromobacter seleniivolatilans TaxID=3047478 RepID=UPI0035291F8B